MRLSLLLCLTARLLSAQTVTTDQFSANVTVTRSVDAKDVQVRLRSVVGKRDGSVVHQLYVADNHDGDWKVWERANGEDGSVLPFATILNKIVSCGSHRCRLNEHFTALLSDSLLRAHENGYAVKFYAKTGETLVVSVPAAVIAVQLATVDSIRAVRQGP